MHVLKESGITNMWEVVVDGKGVGTVAKFSLAGGWMYVGTLRSGMPANGGPFNSQEKAAQAVENAQKGR